MKTRHVLATTVTALLVSPALATAAHAADGSVAAPAHSAVAVQKGGKTPIAAVQGFAKTLQSEKGKATCALMTKGYQKKTVKAAVKGGAAKPGSSCASVMTKLGKAVNANGGIPAYTLKVTKQTKSTAVVRLTYKKLKVSGTYSTTRVGGTWLISGSTVDA
jgi:hypothetical protein